MSYLYRIYFSLPKDLSVPVAEMEMLFTSMPIAGDRFTASGEFVFSNKVWDELEQEIEGRVNGDAPAQDAAAASERPPLPPGEEFLHEYVSSVGRPPHV